VVTFARYCEITHQVHTLAVANINLRWARPHVGRKHQQAKQIAIDCHGIAKWRIGLLDIDTAINCSNVICFWLGNGMNTQQ